MYSDAKNAKNKEIIDINIQEKETKYSIVNNSSNNKDILIWYDGFVNKNTKYLIIDNHELVGKEYIIIAGNAIIYYDTIQENKNLFPKENLPIYLLKSHRINILIKNIENIYDKNDFKLLIKNMYTNDDVDIIAEPDNNKDFMSIEWKINKNEKQNFNLLRIHKEWGMAGVRYSDNNDNVNIYKYVKNYIEQNSSVYELSLNIIRDKFTKIIEDQNGWNIEVFFRTNNLKIKKISNINNDNTYKYFPLIDFLDCYHYDRLIGELVYANICNNNIDILSENIIVKMQNVPNNIFEQILIGDAVENISFYCSDKIFKIEMNLYDKCDQNKMSSYELPFEKTDFGYKIYQTETYFCFPGHNCKIIIYSDNNSPIYIKYDLCVFNSELRRNVAMSSSLNNIIILSNKDKEDYYFYKKNFINNLDINEKSCEILEINKNLEIIL
jgi:hypothetical protein